MADSTDPIIGHGKSLAYSDTEQGQYTPIPKTIEVNLPERELSASETTNDDSADFHKEYIPGLYEPGTVSFTYRYTAAGFAIVEDLYALAQDAGTRSDAIKWWKVTLPDGSTAVFQGFITANNLPAEQEDALVSEGELQVTGPMTFTAAQQPT